MAAALLAVAAAAWITGLVNVFNFMDGVNGISGVHALIAGVAYACYAEWGQHPFLLAASLAVAVSALLFLPWNAVRARVFLGDAGSYSLGAALAVLAADAVLRGVPVEAVLGPLALYLADTAWTLQRRIRTGERWLQAHRTHVYQQWCDAGWSHQEVTLLAGAVTILLTLLGTVSLSRDLTARAAADRVGIGSWRLTCAHRPCPVPRLRQAGTVPHGPGAAWPAITRRTDPGGPSNVRVLLTRILPETWPARPLRRGPLGTERRDAVRPGPCKPSA